MIRFPISLILVFCIIAGGCESQNPICSENYCLVGEIFPKDELQPNQVFDELPGNINEAQLLSLFSENPNSQIKHLPNDPDDVFYINGVVNYIDPNGGAILMSRAVPNEDFRTIDKDMIRIWVTDDENPERLAAIQLGKRYTFKVEILDADRRWSTLSDTGYNYSLWTRLIDIQ